MWVLKISFLGDKDRKDLASVYSNEDGTFRVTTDLPEDEKYFTELINQISKDNPTLTLRGGNEEVVGSTIINRTIESIVPNNDVKYLRALWDYFNRSKDTYKGKRIFVSAFYEASTDEIDYISHALFNLYLNIPGFPKIKPEFYKNPYIIGGYFVTGPDFASGRMSVPDVIKDQMKKDLINYDPKEHVFVSIPPEPKTVGAPYVVVVKLPKAIN
jgi:hypothetical protein